MSEPATYPCRFRAGAQALTCETHGGFYAIPQPGEKPNHREGWIWRECQKDKKWCERKPQQELFA